LGLLEVGLKEEEAANGSKREGNSKMTKDANMGVKSKAEMREVTKNESYEAKSLAQTSTEIN